MKKYAILAGVVTVLTTMFSSNNFASWLFSYQPKTPKCFK